MRILLLTVFLLGVASATQADSPKVTGVFSSLRFGTEDVTGVEVFITYSEQGYFAQVQCAEGAVSRPVVVPVQVAGPFVEFTIPVESPPKGYSCPVGRFTGEVSASGMKGHFEGNDWPGFLERRKSYWQ